MKLTAEQNTQVAAFVNSDGRFVTTPHNSDTASGIADLLATYDLTPYKVWSTTVPTKNVYDTVIWANFTPAAPSAGDGQDYANRSLACQGKQFNLQTLLFRDTIDASKPGIRSGLQDALTQVPSGTAGAFKQCGWTSVQLIIQRPANILEKLLATGTGSDASPATMSFEGRLSYQEVIVAMGW